MLRPQEEFQKLYVTTLMNGLVKARPFTAIFIGVGSIWAMLEKLLGSTNVSSTRG
jgi:hypothetical protein